MQKQFLKQKNGITLIALILTIIVMIILATVGISLALGNGGLVNQAVNGKRENQKAQAFFDAKHKVADIIANGEAQGLSKEEIQKKIDEFFETDEGKKLLERIKEEYNLDSLEEAKKKIVEDYYSDDNKSSDDRAPMILKMNVTEWSELPVSKFPEGCFVDWGDGVKSRSLKPTQEGEKIVKIYGDFQGGSFGLTRPKSGIAFEKETEVGDWATEEFMQGITQILDWGENNFGGMIFEGLYSLEDYVAPRKRSFENVRLVKDLFKFSSVERFDPNIFANAPNLEVVDGVYSKTMVENTDGIENIFANNKKLRVIEASLDLLNFQSIPGEVFKNLENLRQIQMINQKATLDASVLKTLPSLEGLSIKMTNNFTEDMFSACKNLKYVEINNFSGPIPENLFANNPNLESVKLNSRNATGSIPGRIFANNPKLYVASFYDCSGLTGSIPENLFANNPNLKNVASCFDGCSNLTGPVPGKLFANNPNLKDATSLFYNCSKLTGPLPDNMFANNPEVTNVYQIFYGCSGLTGSIPKNIFGDKITDLGLAFYECSNLTGPAPDWWNKGIYMLLTFKGCTKLSNYNEIPAVSK